MGTVEYVDRYVRVLPWEDLEPAKPKIWPLGGNRSRKKAITAAYVKD